MTPAARKTTDTTSTTTSRSTETAARSKNDATAAEQDAEVADTTSFTEAQAATQPVGSTTVIPVAGSDGPRSQLELDEQRATD